ncbi:hypothetical protein SAMD00019534_022140, partial [Acytostelium subglobosum LB1]|uniref:hypothetical protein n=1 Tax=Acytostelium subglobosum LB1 TaxID=1410327 RepID=UPI000645140D
TMNNNNNNNNEQQQQQQQTYYNILNIEQDADYNSIKSAYKTMVLLHHPDKQGGNADMFDRIQIAWKCLKDDNQRRLYDSTLLENNRYKHSISDEIDLDDMLFNEHSNQYSYPCRCSGTYSISGDQLEMGHDIACCQSCSLTIKVLYEE